MYESVHEASKVMRGTASAHAVMDSQFHEGLERTHARTSWTCESSIMGC